MVLKATKIAMDEQNAILDKQRSVVDAGVESSCKAAAPKGPAFCFLNYSSQDTVTRAARSAAYSAEVVACLEFISIEPERHYGIFLTGLNWKKSGRPFCITSNIGVPMGQERNRTIAINDCVVRVFSCATAFGQTHYETMAHARSCTDKHLKRDHLPKIMIDCLQCTALGHPMKLLEPTAAAHAVGTPLTLQARLHTIPMVRAYGCEWAYDQMDRYQKATDKETYYKLAHSWDDAKVALVMAVMQQVCAYEKVNVDFVIESENKIVISPGPDSNAQIERLCSEYCHHLRLSGEAEVALHFRYSKPHRPDPIPSSIKTLLEYMLDLKTGVARWSLATARATSGVPPRQLGDGTGQAFLETALVGTGRFRPQGAAQDETTLALRATNTELAKRLAASEQRSAAFQEDMWVQAHKFQEEMRMLVQNTLARNVAVKTEAEARNAATQRQLDALVATVKALPDGAQVLLKAAAAADQPDETDAGTAEKKSAGDGDAGGEEAAPSGTDPNAGAPPAPEHAEGLDDRGAPTETPPPEELCLHSPAYHDSDEIPAHTWPAAAAPKRKPS